MSGNARDALRRARDWLAAEGDGKGALLCDALLGERPASDAEAALSAPADPEGAIRALHWLRALGLPDGKVAAESAGLLAARQEGDGGWPPSPGEPRELRAARALAAAACTIRVSPSRLHRASAFLAERWSVDALAAGGEEAVCAWFPALCHAPGDLADEALQWCGRELERGFRTGRFGPGAVARVFADCDAHALPGARLRAAEVLEALLAIQSPEGSFPGDTLEAARALSFLASAAEAMGDPC